MKKLFLPSLLLLLIVCMTACGSGKPAEAEAENPIAGKVYQVNAYGDDLDWKWCRFNDDGTYQGVNSKWLGSVNGKPDYSLTSVYGTYTLDGAALTMASGEKSISAVVKDDGARIMIGKTELLDKTTELADDPLMRAFD